MSAPLVNFITAEEARKEYQQLKESLSSSLEEFERRARCYELTAEERRTWDRIEDLRWLFDFD